MSKLFKKYLTLHVDNSKQQKWRTCDFPVWKKRVKHIKYEKNIFDWGRLDWGRFDLGSIWFGVDLVWGRFDLLPTERAPMALTLTLSMFLSPILIHPPKNVWTKTWQLLDFYTEKDSFSLFYCVHQRSGLSMFFYLYHSKRVSKLKLFNFVTKHPQFHKSHRLSWHTNHDTTKSTSFIVFILMCIAMHPS